MPVRSALTLVAHGSKNAAANQHIAHLVEELKVICREKYAFINYGFLQFAKPSIEEAISAHILNDIKNIYIFPFFLAPGNHIENDIPNILQEVKSRYENLNLIMLPLFGRSQHMVEWINSTI